MSVDDADDYEVTHHLFQPGELIVAENQACHYIYVITEGEVEVSQRQPDSGTVMEVRGPGRYFGQDARGRAATESVRARSVVRAVSVRNDQVRRLHNALAPLGELVAASQMES